MELSFNQMPLFTTISMLNLLCSEFDVSILVHASCKGMLKLQILFICVLSNIINSI